MARFSTSIQAQIGKFHLNVAFEMKGETTAIIGASGAGKTLALRAIAGLLHPTDGRITLSDRVLFDSTIRLSIPTRERKIGYVFQDYALFPHLTVAKNLSYALHGWDKNQRAARTRELVDLLDLSGLESRLPSEISGGQQQRVALGRALAPGPELVLLDEPFSAVDAPARALLTEQLHALQARLGFAMVLVTHDVSEAYALASQLVMLSKGFVIQKGPREDVFHAPASAEVARLLGFRNLFPGRVVGNDGGITTVDIQGVRVYSANSGVPTGTLVLCGVHPQSIGLVRYEDAALQDQSNVLSVTVAQRTDRGVQADVTLALDGHDGKGPLLHSTVHQVDLSAELLPGALYKAVIPQQAVHLWRVREEL
jgi:molybdate transport system ATP-binding protein